MEVSFEMLLASLDRIAGEYFSLRDGIRKAVEIASIDPEMALTRSRKVLELVLRDVYQRRCNESPGTRPLENLVHRLVKDGHLPRTLEAYATTVRLLGNVGGHVFGERVTIADVYRSLAQLLPILEWYFETQRPPVEVTANQSVVSAARTDVRREPSAQARLAPRRVMWVDDNPANNQFEVMRLRDDQIEVVEALTTAEAMYLLGFHRQAMCAVISDMGRQEDGDHRPRAGLELIRAMRRIAINVPVFIYTSARSADRTRDEVVAAGGAGATASSVELFELVSRLIVPAA
jgi:CheY-like chemotaxis protein